MLEHTRETRYGASDQKFIYNAWKKLGDYFQIAKGLAL
jgi:hypothetical protein